VALGPTSWILTGLAVNGSVIGKLLCNALLHGFIERVMIGIERRP